MGIISKLANLKYESGANYELGHSVGGSGVANLFGSGGSRINVLEEYNGIAWKAIDVRAETLASQDLFVEQYVGQKWQPAPNHPFNLVLEGGNGQYNQSELLEAHEKSMCLYGESFWYFSKGESFGKPMAVYLLDPNFVSVFTDGTKVTGYVYQRENQRIVLDVEEVLHFRIHDVRHPWRGYGPMQAAGWFVRSSRYVNTYVNNFLENNAIPAGVIVAKGQVDDNDWALFKEQWVEKYSSINNSGKTGFVRGSDIDFVQTGLSLGDVDFSKIKDSTREDIMVMFGISKPMMAMFQDINRAAAVTAKGLFADTVTAPALMKLKRKMSKAVAQWYGSQYRIASTDPSPDDPDQRLAVANALLGRAITLNEARAAFGYGPLAGGDEIDPTLASGTARAPVVDPKAAPASVAKKLIIRTRATGFSVQMKENFRSEMEDLQIKTEQQVFQAVNPILKAQRDAVIEQLQPKKVADSHFNPQQEADTMTLEIVPILVELAKEQGQLAIDFVGSNMTFKVSSVMEKYIHDSIAKATLGFNEDTQAKIAKTLADGLNDGRSVADIAADINKIYDDVLGVKTPGYRIERLVRTEVIKASNEVTQVAYKDSGVVTKNEWYANPGACEYCAALSGSVISLGAAFVPLNSTLEGVDGGTRINDYETIEHPPAHSNCRCTIIPVVEA